MFSCQVIFSLLQEQLTLKLQEGSSPYCGDFVAGHCGQSMLGDREAGFIGGEMRLEQVAPSNAKGAKFSSCWIRAQGDLQSSHLPAGAGASSWQLPL